MRRKPSALVRPRPFEALKTIAGAFQYMQHCDGTCTSKKSKLRNAVSAGILSSYGEMEHMHSGKAQFVPFDPHAKQPKMSYKVIIYRLKMHVIRGNKWLIR